METKPSYAESLRQAHGNAQWVAQTLGFLAEILGGDVEPCAVSEDARIGLGRVLEECAGRAWSAEGMLGVAYREAEAKEVAHG